MTRKSFWLAFLVVVIVVLIAMFLGGRYMFGHSKVVGRDIDFADITEFYFTRASSTYPPAYQRYHFSAADGVYRFDHETREGRTFPLREDDITVSGTLELTTEQWEAFLSYLYGGSVRKRSESIESGGSGPSLYLYWNGDRGSYQQFSFAAWDGAAAFEAFCETLRGE